MRRGTAAAALILALTPAAAVAQQDEDPIEPTFILDTRGDADGPLDVVRTAMSLRGERRLRADVTMRRSWDADDLRPDGSICMKLYVTAEPDAEPPEYLVCATPPAEGDELRGRVLRNRSNGLPRSVDAATVSRPTRRTIHLRFARSAIGRPDEVGFAAEAVTHGEGCPRATGCVDVGPDAPAVRTMRLHRGPSSG